ncbi:MAG: nuclear transport factor 2 family protein [Deltaproteobacteria bacterium]|nr:MAG: nuclear transport factor 2 family protein [Deltaproteobacteria bacterium]
MGPRLPRLALLATLALTAPAAHAAAPAPIWLQPGQQVVYRVIDAATPFQVCMEDDRSPAAFFKLGITRCQATPDGDATRLRCTGALPTGRFDGARLFAWAEESTVTHEKAGWRVKTVDSDDRFIAAAPGRGWKAGKRERWLGADQSVWKGLGRAPEAPPMPTGEDDDMQLWPEVTVAKGIGPVAFVGTERGRRISAELLATDGASPLAAPSEDDARALLERWLAAQNGGDQAAYAALYADGFSGVRRSGEKVRRFDRKGWLKDRKGMFAKPMTVAAHDVVYATGGGSGFLVFLQSWKNEGYQDLGPKTLRIGRDADGQLRIREEELHASVVPATVCD